MTHKNYYKILGVPQNATPDAIRKAYRGLARRYHPDTSAQGKADASRFQELTEAYQTLNDATKRANYDRRLHQPASRPSAQPYAHAYTKAAPRYQEPAPTGPIHSTQATTKDIFAGATLFIMVFACAFLVFGLYQIVSLFTAEAMTVQRMATLTADEWQQKTQQARLTATARAYPTHIPAAEHRLTQLASATLLTDDSPSCVLDLVNNREDCRSIPQIGLPAFYDGGAVLRVDLDPRTYSHTRLVLVVTYAANPTGLTVNISDNPISEGKPLGNQQNAELVIEGNDLSVYGRTEAPSHYATLAHRPDFVSKEQTVIFEVADQRQGWINAVGGERLVSRYLYALGGQPDGYGEKHYTVYAAFNRPIRIGATPDRFGTGVTRVEVWLLPAD